MEEHSRDGGGGGGAETPTKRGLFLANEYLLCLPPHPDARAVGFQITAVNFAQLPHAWLPVIWVFTLFIRRCSLRLLSFHLFCFLSLPAALVHSSSVRVMSTLLTSMYFYFCGLHNLSLKSQIIQMWQHPSLLLTMSHTHTINFPNRAVCYVFSTMTPARIFAT